MWQGGPRELQRHVGANHPHLAALDQLSHADSRLHAVLLHNPVVLWQRDKGDPEALRHVHHRVGYPLAQRHAIRQQRVELGHVRQRGRGAGLGGEPQARADSGVLHPHDVSDQKAAHFIGVHEHQVELLRLEPGHDLRVANDAVAVLRVVVEDVKQLQEGQAAREDFAHPGLEEAVGPAAVEEALVTLQVVVGGGRNLAAIWNEEMDLVALLVQGGGKSLEDVQVRLKHDGRDHH